MRKIFKRGLFWLILCLCPGLNASGAGADSLSLAKLSGMLDEYLTALESEDLPSKISECDFILANTPDDSTKAFVCSYILKYYMNTKVMGDEAVAVFLYDAWIRPGNITALDKAIASDARLFAEFNRSTLLGMDAPSLELYSPSGETVTLPGNSGARKILYFYDVSCSKCKLESMLLCHILEEVKAPVELFAVYVGSDEGEWRKYIRERFPISNQLVIIHHCADLEGTTDMVKLYSLLQTPRLYLTDSSGVIEGRRLDVEALLKILKIEEARDAIASSRFSSGDTLPSIKVPGTLVRRSRSYSRTMNLKRLHGTALVFYSHGCPRCSEAIEGLKAEGKKLFLVDMESIFSTDKALGMTLLDNFDLSVLPEIIEH